MRAVLPALIAILCGAAILPHNRIIDWLAARAIPNNGCFSLIGDAQSAELVSPQISLVHRLASRSQGRLPYLIWVLFYPTGVWEKLLEFDLSLAMNGVLMIKHYAPRRRGALVDGDDKTRCCCVHTDFLQFFILIYCVNAMRCIELSGALALWLGYHNHFSGAG